MHSLHFTSPLSDLGNARKAVVVVAAVVEAVAAATIPIRRERHIGPKLIVYKRVCELRSGRCFA